MKMKFAGKLIVVDAPDACASGMGGRNLIEITAGLRYPARADWVFTDSYGCNTFGHYC